MEFAILFIIAFLAGYGIFKFMRNWIPAVGFPMALFAINTLLDVSAKEAWLFTLVFGLPLVLFASLLGAYVVQIRSPEYIDSLVEDEVESSEPESDNSKTEHQR